MKLFEANKTLLEQTMIATVQLQTFHQGRAPHEVFSATELSPVRELATLGSRTLLNASYRVGGEKKTKSEFFRAIVESIPEDLRPKDEQLDFFLSENANSGYVRIKTVGSSQQDLDVFTIELIAPDEETAKARVETMVSLLQRGIADPIQQYVTALQADLNSRIRAGEARLEDIRQSRDELTQMLASAPECEVVELNRLKTQRQLFEVEIVGVRARIQAVEQLRAQHEHDMDVGKKLDDIKMAAEIDLAGLAASIKALAEIIDRGDKKMQLESESQRLKNEYSSVGQNLENARRRLDELQPALETMGTLLMPKEGEVTIAPITWVQ